MNLGISHRILNQPSDRSLSSAPPRRPPLPSEGSKAAPRPGGIGSAAAGQPGMEGDSMLSKILPGGAAEQAGKLGDGIRNNSTLKHYFPVIW